LLRHEVVTKNTVKKKQLKLLYCRIVAELVLYVDAFQIDDLPADQSSVDTDAVDFVGKLSVWLILLQ